MTNLQHAIEAYILGKDGNRPHLLTEAFAPDALLRMTVQTATIAFPPQTRGAGAIASLLSSGFALKYENVYTFCVGDKPAGGQAGFSCDWLVCMTEKATGAARVGYGRYDWTFDAASSRIAELHILIEDMAALPPADAAGVLAWARRLPYPWCGREALAKHMPDVDAVRRAAARLAR